MALCYSLTLGRAALRGGASIFTVAITSLQMDFAQSFRSEEFADVQLILLCRAAAPSQDDDPPESHTCSDNFPDVALEAADQVPGPPRAAEPRVIDSFPAHRIFLCRSDYFKAQVRR